MKTPDYDWWVQHAHSDSAFLLLTEYPDAFEQAIQARLTQVGRPLEQGLVNQAKWRAIWEQDRYGSMSSILASITPVVDIPTRSLNGPISISKRSLRDDGGVFLGLGVSAFWAPWAVSNSRERLEKLGEWAEDAGINYVRIFGAHDWPGGSDFDSDTIAQVVDLLAGYGLRTQVTMGTRRQQFADPEQAIIDLADVVNSRRDKICLVEIANEFNHDDNGWSEDEVRHLAGRFIERCDAPLALSAPAAPTWGDNAHQLTELYTDAGATATTIHFPRRDNTHEGPWRAVRQPWHMRHGIPGCPDFVVDNEHKRWDKSQGQKVEVAVAHSLVAYIAGCGMSCHHDLCGVFPSRPGYSEQPQAGLLKSAFRSLMNALPGDLPDWQSVRVGEGGGPHPFPSLLPQHWSFHDTLNYGVSRAFAAVNGEKFVMALTGVKDCVHLHEEQPHAYRVVSLRDGETVYEGEGPVSIDAAKGEAFFVGTI